MKLLLDENLSTAQTSILQRVGHDAVSVYGVGLCGAPDEEVRRFAIETGRVLVTLDADFAHIHRFSPMDTPGVIRLKIHPPTEAAIEALLLGTITALQNQELHGKLVVADQRRIRIRSG